MTPDKILRVEFTTTPPFNVVPDALLLQLGFVTVPLAHGSRTGAIFDGPTLLGSATTTSFAGFTGLLQLSPAVSWKSPESLWAFDSPGTIDFTSIRDGSIAGEIEFTIATGAMDITLSDVELLMLHATSDIGGAGVSPGPQILSVDIVPTPEPSTLLLLGLGLLGVAGICWRRNRRSSSQGRPGAAPSTPPPSGGGQWP